jgi:hypothetical protein
MIASFNKMFRAVLRSNGLQRGIATAHRPNIQLRPTGLGRWNIEKTPQEVEIHIDLANSDHCGGELCTEKPLQQINASAPNGKGDDDDDDFDNYCFPFLL